jgi:hypothetical protein
MRNSMRGGSPLGWIVGLVVVAVIVLGVVYFTSDVFRTKANQAFKNFAEWTPENIAADPVGYLDFCEEQTNDAMAKLKASKIAIQQKHAKIAGMKEEAGKTVRSGTKMLAEAKAAYKAADGAGAWPVEWMGEDRSQEWMKRQIVTTHAELAGNEKLLKNLDKGMKRLEAEKTRVLDTETKLQQQLAEIQTNREMVKVNQITDDLTTQLANIKGALQAIIPDASDPDSVLRIPDFQREAGTTVDEAEFEQIMSE